MRRRLLAALVPFAVLAIALSGCAPVNGYEATTVAGADVWTGKTWCTYSARKGGEFDIVDVTLERTTSRPYLTVTFRLRKPPRTDEAATAGITFRNASGKRAGVLVTRWSGRSAAPTVAELDRITGRSRLLTTTPVVDTSARTVTTTYPTDLFGWGQGFWYWDADTYVGGEHRDNCTAHPRPLKPGPGDAFLR